MGNEINWANNAGIYKLTCSISGKIYIGKSCNIKRRLYGYKTFNSKNKKMYHFLYALEKYGWDAFSVEILEILENFNKDTDKDKLFERESFYIKLFDATNPETGYNICGYSTDRTGIPTSEETKIKIGNANRGRFVSFETREKNRLASLGNTNKRGKKLSEESKENIRIAVRGRKLSEDHKRKIGRSLKGKKHTEESKQKMRKPKINRENLGKSFLGKKHTEETKQKMREAKAKSKEEKNHNL